MNLKNVLSQVLSAITKNERLIVGAAASGLVALAGDLHIVVSSTSLAAILTPFVTSILVELDNKVGVAKTVKTLLPPWGTTTPPAAK